MQHDRGQAPVAEIIGECGDVVGASGQDQAVAAGPDGVGDMVADLLVAGFVDGVSAR